MHDHSHQPSAYGGNVKDGLERPGFCRNLFGCRAGALPWRTAAEFDHRYCEACPPDGLSAALLRLDQLRQHIERCPICLSFLGLPRDGKIETLNPTALLKQFSEADPKDLLRHCVICGSQPIAVLNWMASDDFFTDTGGGEMNNVLVGALKSSVAGSYPVPSFPATQGMELLELLLGRPENEDIYDTILDLNLFKTKDLSPADLAIHQFDVKGC
jgi:hypothetical protein